MDFLRNSEGHFWVDSRDAIASKKEQHFKVLKSTEKYLTATKITNEY